MASDELRRELEQLLQRLDIHTVCVEHPEVFTVEQMMPHLSHLSGAVTKNLFLKDKRGRLFLLSVCAGRALALGELAKRVGAAGLRLAPEPVLRDTLRVGQGCVTPLALFCDTEHRVTALLDRQLIHGGHTHVYCHPMSNSATVGLAPADLLRFLRETGHKPIILSLDGSPDPLM